MDFSWIIYLFAAFIISVCMTYLFMPILLKLCRRRGMYDIPDERKVHHSNNIPRMGGVLFIPCMLCGVAGAMALMMTNSATSMVQFNMPTLFAIIGMFLLYLIGILDDLFGMPATLKFVIQLIVSLFLPFCGLYIHNLYGFLGIYEIPGWLGFPFTVFVSLLIVNAINLIDGIDGLASGLSFLAIAVFGVLFFSKGMTFYALYCMALLGTILVFFLFNMFGNPEKGTKTFMGDTGSLTLGYALTFLAIRYIMTGHPQTVTGEVGGTALLVPFTLVIIPCFDLVRVAMLRIKRGVSIFYPDKTHIHHKCLQAGFSMHLALIMIVSLQLCFCFVNFGLVYLDCNVSLIVFLDIAIFLLFNLWLNRRIANRKTVSTL